MFVRWFWLKKTERKKETSVDLPESRNSSQKASGSLTFVLKSVEILTSNWYRRISYPNGTVLRTKLSNWPCLSSLRFGSRRGDVQSVLTLGGHCVRTPRSELRASNGTRSRFQAQLRLSLSCSSLHGRLCGLVCAERPQAAAQDQAVQIW